MKTENKGVFVEADTLRQTPTADLQLALKDAKDSLFHLREQSAGFAVPRNKLDCRKPHLMKGYKKLIARIETVLAEKHLRNVQKNDRHHNSATQS